MVLAPPCYRPGGAFNGDTNAGPSSLIRVVARLVALIAGVGFVVGGAVATTVHFLTWTIPAHSIGTPRRYTDYLPVPAGTGPYSSALTVHFAGANGMHPSWWPLLPIGLSLGLGTGAILGAAVTLTGVRLGRAPGNDSA